MQAERVFITEVGPRDGLQNEQKIVAAADKIAMVDRLSMTGLAEIEVSAFVRPDKVPQLADAAEVFSGIERRPGVCYSALVPNERGLDHALAAGVDKVCLFTAASESFARANTDASIAETIDRFRPVVDRCVAVGLPVRAYVSCAVACPYEGPVEPTAVAGVMTSLLALGELELDLGDTIGAAGPRDIGRLLRSAAEVTPIDDIVLHLHDTGGAAIACAREAIEMGVRRFDGSCGGLGGCPYAPGAPGNLATESLVALCDDLGYETGVSSAAVEAVGAWIRSST